jgi:hypothetical protein
MISQNDITEILLAMPDEPTFNEYCFSKNPRLWALWCKVRNRQPTPSYVWTEGDVVVSLDKMIEEYDEAGKRTA